MTNEDRSIPENGGVILRLKEQKTYTVNILVEFVLSCN